MKRLCWLSFAFFLASYLCKGILDPDFWWHLTVGKWILSHRAVPLVDYWNQFSAGNPWIAYSWFFEALIALTNQFFGFSGLYFLKLFFALLLALTFLGGLCFVSKSPFVGGVLGTFAVAGCLLHFGLRPQSIAWALFAVTLVLASQVREAGFRKSSAGYFFLIMLLWANTNITPILGLAVFFVWSLEVSCNQKSVKTSGGLTGIGFLGTLCTPYFGAEWLTFFQKANHPFENLFVVEFQPVTLYHPTAGLLLLLFALFGMFLHYRPQSINLLQKILVLSFFLAAFAVRKFIPFGVILTCFAIAFLWSKEMGSKEMGHREKGKAEAFGPLGIAIKKAEEVLTLRSMFLQVALMLGFGAISVFNIQKTLKEPIKESLFPIKAVDFIEEHSLGHPLLNLFRDGGYLMYRYSDESGNPLQKVILDGRTNVNDPKVAKAFKQALNGRPNWGDYLALTNPRTILWKNKFPLVSILRESPKWREVYTEATPEDPMKGYSVFVLVEDAIR